MTGRGERVEKLAKCPNFLNNFAQPTVHNGLKVSKVFTYLQKAPKVFFQQKGQILITNNFDRLLEQNLRDF